MRRWSLILTISVLASFAYCQEWVFVDLKKMVSLHPAWKMAERFEGERKPLPRVWDFPVPLLTEVPLSLTLPPIEPFLEYMNEQRKLWTSELNLLQRHRRQVHEWQLQLALPVLPFVDPVAQWKFIVREREKQAPERVRLNLRLAFSNLLPPEEKQALEKRLRELDAELEPKPKAMLLPSLSITLSQQLNLELPSELTNPQAIFELVAPPPPPPQTTFVLRSLNETAKVTPKLLTANVSSVLQATAHNMAQAFALAYARQRGWKVVFKPQEGVRDVTGEVLMAWHFWLERTKPKE
ncbi:MAG: hypothetical protein ACUVSC_00240 [Candidatus Fervidibacter sp.]|uniref:hypothetical protein n=1 Tax=Candidatus Fervidibacter sp. TaxID=3100871 RepID=UPI00404AFE19